jgi:hypothetical protein
VSVREPRSLADTRHDLPDPALVDRLSFLAEKEPARRLRPSAPERLILSPGQICPKLFSKLTTHIYHATLPGLGVAYLAVADGALDWDFAPGEVQVSRFERVPLSRSQAGLRKR